MLQIKLFRFIASVQIAKASSDLTIQCAPIGRYDMVLMARNPCVFEMKTIFHHPNDNWSLLKLIESSKLKWQNRIKKREMVVRWNRRWISFVLINKNWTTLLYAFETDAYYWPHFTFTFKQAWYSRCSLLPSYKH